MQKGKLGVVILILAITGTLLVSWTMSMDVNTVQVTKYNPLADITGEFETEQTPDYTSYSPSTNYTGYYTDASTVGYVRYFDGVEFTPSQLGNNFRIQERPTETVTGSVDLNNVAGAQINSGDSAYYSYEYNGTTYGKSTGRSSTIAISALIAALDPTGQYDAFVFRSGASMDAANPTPDSDLTVDWLFFFAESQEISQNINLTSPGASGQLVPAGSIYPPLSAFVERASGLTTIYYDNDLDPAHAIGTFSTSECSVMFEYPTIHSYNLGLIIGDTLDYDILKLPARQYMDPSKGVELS